MTAARPPCFVSSLRLIPPRYARQPVAFFDTAGQAVAAARGETPRGLVRSVLLIAEQGTLDAARGTQAGKAALGPSLAAEGGYALVRITPSR